MGNITKIISKSLSMSKTEKEKLQTFIRTAKKPPTVLFSFKHFSPNYFSLVPLHIMAEFAKGGCKIVLMIRDVSVYEERERLVKGQSDKEFIDHMVDDIYNIVLSFGAPKENVLVYKFSDLWKRLVAVKEPSLFFEYYKMTGEINVEEFLTPETLGFFANARHVMQNPADIFIANFFGMLAPESGIDRITIVMGRSKRRQFFYEYTRDMLFKGGWIKDEIPVFAYMRGTTRFSSKKEPVPNIYYDESEILDAMKRDKKFEWKKKAPDIFRNMLTEFMDSFELDGEMVELDKILKFLKKADKQKTISLLARNIYLSNLKLRKIMKLGIVSYPVKVCKAEDIKNLGKIMKSKHMMEILKFSDGTMTPTKLSKKLNIHPANMSKYIAFLEKSGLLAINPQGKLEKRHKRFVVDVETL